MKKNVLAIAGLMFATFAISGELFTGWSSQPKEYQLADPLEVDSTMGGYPIWAGEGKWRVMELKKFVGSGATPDMGSLEVFQTESGKMVSFLAVRANVGSANASDWTDEPCKRDDYLYKASLGGTFRDVNCISLNHIVGYPGNPGGKGAELFALLKKEKIETPPTVLRMIWTRYSSGGRRLQYSLTINPELAGFARDAEPEWGRNSWHKSQVANDPAKKKFVDDLSVWALAFAKQMDPAFKKQVDAFNVIPSWRSVYDTTAKAESVKAKATLD